MSKPVDGLAGRWAGWLMNWLADGQASRWADETMSRLADEQAG
ncbi:hypothetical protein [Amycolatopsis sp. PS_44_ISF1]|nr:hypothetical protein [Amycolatopsis sp. PS_44_ISF1]MDT8913828.1 hypothetical protein [Amycolatopsis sp. PS_44_ISF1]